MKTLITILISFLSFSALAQNVNITFAGANRNKNFQVVIDGASYYSANSVSTNGRQVTTVPGLSIGSHSLQVYDVGNNNNTSSDGNNNSVTGEPVYEKSFQLRQGYDMNISIRANGMVSFTEVRSQNQNTVSGGVSMSTTAFNQLLTNVRNKRYQSEKITMITNAFKATANSFSTSQVKQLLALVTSESQRLELAKLSYKKVTDRDNFTTVYDVLKSEASRDSLDDYVVSQGGVVSTDVDNNAAYGNRTAMAFSNFNQLIQRVQNQASQTSRVSEIRNALNNSNNYFSTAQLKQLLLLVSSETNRLVLAKLAYPQTSDLANFNVLVDLFYTQYNRDELNNFIVNSGGTANNNTVNNNTTYKSPMTDASFNQIYTKARSHFFQKNTVNDIRTAFVSTTNNFSTEQVKQLLMLSTAEADRLALAKLAYPRVVDPANFSQLLDLFTGQSNRNDLDIFIKAQ